jgi:hypothetical protein
MWHSQNNLTYAKQNLSKEYLYFDKTFEIEINHGTAGSPIGKD